MKWWLPLQTTGLSIVALIFFVPVAARLLRVGGQLDCVEFRFPQIWDLEGDQV